MGELVDQARFAHASFGNQRHDLAVTATGELLCMAELFQLPLAAHEARKTPTGDGLEPGPHRADARHLVHFQWFDEPFDRYWSERLHGDKAVYQFQRRGRHQDAARVGELLHARGQMRRSSDGCVIHTQIAADGAHNDVAGVQSNADLQVHAVRMEDGFSMALDVFLHTQGGVAGPYSVILMSEGSAEQRHDAVARSLVDGAFVVVDGLHHEFEHWVEELARLLGVTVGQQLHRTFEIGEQHSDLLALTFDCRLGVQDFRGQVLGCVSLRCAIRRLRGRGQAGRMRALRTELRRRRQRIAAAYTCPCQRRRALCAELRCAIVEMLALRTFHRRPSRRRTHPPQAS